MTCWLMAPSSFPGKQAPQGGWGSGTWLRGSESMWGEGEKGGEAGGGEGGRRTQRFSGAFIEEPGSSDARYYILTVSEDANSGVACFYLKHRCFSWSYNSIVLQRVTWFRIDEARMSIWYPLY